MAGLLDILSGTDDEDEAKKRAAEAALAQAAPAPDAPAPDVQTPAPQYGGNTYGGNTYGGYRTDQTGPSLLDRLNAGVKDFISKNVGQPIAQATPDASGAMPVQSAQSAQTVPDSNTNPPNGLVAALTGGAVPADQTQTPSPDKAAKDYGPGTTGPGPQPSPGPTPSPQPPGAAPQPATGQPTPLVPQSPGPADVIQQSLPGPQQGQKPGFWSNPATTGFLGQLGNTLTQLGASMYPMLPSQRAQMIAGIPAANQKLALGQQVQQANAQSLQQKQDQYSSLKQLWGDKDFQKWFQQLPDQQKLAVRMHMAHGDTQGMTGFMKESGTIKPLANGGFAVGQRMYDSNGQLVFDQSRGINRIADQQQSGNPMGFDLDKMKKDASTAGVNGDALDQINKEKGAAFTNRAYQIATYQYPLTISARNNMANNPNSPDAQLAQAAQMINPRWAPNNYGEVPKIRNEFFGSTENGKKVQGLDMLYGHIADYREAMQALDNGQFPAVNRIVNEARKQAGLPAIEGANLSREAVSHEFASVFRQQGSSEADIARWIEAVDSAKSPAQIDEVVRRGLSLVESRKDAVVHQYNERFRQIGLNAPQTEFFTPEHVSKIDKIKQQLGSGSAPAQPNQGSAPSIPTVSNADDYSKLPKGTQYKDPSGQLRTKK